MSIGRTCGFSPVASEARAAGVFLTTFSTKLFHAPQAGHFPAHFGDS
jgi:hypothetical protein